MMTMPGFTAEASLYMTSRNYVMGDGTGIASVARSADGRIVPQFDGLICVLLGLSCLAALADGVPFDEVITCGTWFRLCSEDV